MDQLDQFDRRLRRITMLLYAAATIFAVTIANIPGLNEGFQRTWINLLAPTGLASIMLVRLVPWHRYNRNLFLVMTASSLVLVALLVYLTGGWTSPFDVYFFLTVVFAALYYSRRVTLLVGALVSVISFSPLLYSVPTTESVLRRLIVSAVYMITSWAGSWMAGELGRREHVRRGLEADLTEIRRLRDELASANELERRRIKGLLALQRTGATVYGFRETRAAIGGILAEMVRSLGYEYVSVYQREGDYLVMTDQLGYPKTIERIPIGHGVMSRSLLSGKSILLTDLSKDTDALRAFPGIISEVCVPLRIEGVVVGVVNVETTTTRLDTTDLELLELFAQQAGGALANARALEAQDRRERRAVAASKLLARLNKNLAVEEVLRAATQGPVEDYNSMAACLWRRQKNSSCGSWIVSSCNGRDLAGSVSAATLDTILERRQPVHLDSVEHAHATGAAEAVSFAGYPLLRGEDMLGVFGVFSEASMDRDDLDFWANFAAQVALSLDNAYSYSREHKRTEQLEAVHDIGREIGAILDPASLCQALVEAVRQRLGYSIVTLFVPAPAGADLVLAAQVGMRAAPGNAGSENLRMPRDEGIVGHVAGSRAPYYTSDVRSDPFYKHLGNTHIRSELAVPVLYGEELMGVLNVESVNADVFDDADVTALEAVADGAAIALQNARAHALLARKATTDALTGIYNHQALMERLDLETERARRYGHYLSALFFDIDYFKQVNDTYGHQTGDLVLQEIVRLGSDSLRQVDTLGRYGGEEFVALLPETGGEEAAQVAERLRARIAAHTFELPDGTKMGITVSVGVATCRGLAASRHELLRTADNALYSAKRLGRNRVYVTGSKREPTPV